MSAGASFCGSRAFIIRSVFRLSVPIATAPKVSSYFGSFFYATGFDYPCFSEEPCQRKELPF